MKFWDSSALLPTFIHEAATARLAALLDAERGLVVWWGTAVECASAIARREREESLTAAGAAGALARLAVLAEEWREVAPSRWVRRTAMRLLRVHALRASDSLPLAAALAASEHETRALDFVCLDERLSLAAAREGFAIVN
jgi:predicted nucleic acid-binding protein